MAKINYTPEQLRSHAALSAQRYGLDPQVFVAQLQQESQFNPTAKNPKSGAAGIGQLMPGTAKELGVKDVYDPIENIDASARYMGQMVRQFGSQKTALQAYNWGLDNVASWLKTGKGVKGQTMPAETVDYTAKIMGGGAPVSMLAKATSNDPLAGFSVGAAAVPPPSRVASATGTHPLAGSKVPAIPTPQGLMVPDTADEVDWMGRIAKSPHDEKTQGVLAQALAQLMPAKIALDGKPLFGDAFPTELDPLIDKLLAQA